jgi:hypothetical protein
MFRDPPPAAEPMAPASQGADLEPGAVVAPVSPAVDLGSTPPAATPFSPAANVGSTPVEVLLWGAPFALPGGNVEGVSAAGRGPASTLEPADAHHSWVTETSLPPAADGAVSPQASADLATSTPGADSASDGSGADLFDVSPISIME